MPSKPITLLVRLTNFDTIIETVVDEELISVVANTDKVIHFFTEDVPQEVRPQCWQQLAVFLEHISEAGDEANLMREYLGDYFTGGDYSAGLFIRALSALTRKDLSTKESLEDVGKWIMAVVSILGEPYITKLVVATLVGGYLPDPEGEEKEKEEFRRLYLSLLK